MNAAIIIFGAVVGWVLAPLVLLIVPSSWLIVEPPVEPDNGDPFDVTHPAYSVRASRRIDLPDWRDADLGPVIEDDE